MDAIFSLNAGVIIIGSLWWEGDEKDDPKDRFQWRLNRLGNSLEEESLKVKLPIRYGRNSDNSGFYTMIFSTVLDGDNDSMGKGFIVPVARNPISTFGQLRNEVKAMANAEGMQNSFIGYGQKSKKGWATMGLLINPKFKEPEILKKWWSEQIEQSGYTKKGKKIDNPLEDFQMGKDPVSVLTEYGAMNINWPQAVDSSCQSEIDNLDILFAACTMPKHESDENRYPTPEEIACAENTKPPGSRDYFRNNRAHGIITFQDGDIMKNLNKSSFYVQ